MNAIWGSVSKPCLLLSLLFLSTANSALAQTAALIVGPVDNAQRITLTGNTHPLARAEFDRGAVDNSLPMTRILLLLKRGDNQEAALQTFMEQQQDKSSPNYHVWLTPAQFGAQYGPADSDVQAVTQWLTSQGFTVGKVYSGKTVIEFSGSAAQVQAAFSTPIHNYQVNGKSYVANSTDPQIPAALAPVVAGIVSLNNFPRQAHVRLAGQARKIVGQPGLEPLFTFPVPGQSFNLYALAPADFATIYSSQSLINSGNNGTGQTIAIVGETDINVADVQAFRQLFGLPANFSSTNVILNGEDPGVTSTDEELEADLDVQWSGAVAPGATVDYVVSESTPSSQGIDLSALYIIEYNLAGVMSESYGACESGLGTGGNAFYNSLWEQAAAQGITVILSAGDGGSAGCDDFNTATVAQAGLAVSGMASTPFNVALGGTDFDEINKWSNYWSATNNATTGLSALGYIPEIPWNQTCAQIGLSGCGANVQTDLLNIVAGSGGASSTYGKPTWQMGVTGMPNDGHRDLPDLSLFASPGFDGSGYIVCAGTGVTTGPSACNLTPGIYNFAVVGGTSAAAPAFAGVMALVNQYQTAHSGSARQGNANYTLYPLAKKSGSSCTSGSTEASTCIFNDVTHGNSYFTTEFGGSVGTNSVPCQGGSTNCSAAVAATNGVLVEPTSASTEAYTVGTGYDLVTGLGSVNINNLATMWGTVNTVATTTTLTLSPTTGITHGTAENVTVNINVTPTSGTATGNVSLIATLAGPNGATTQGIDQFTLASGKVTNAKTNSLPGGTNYQVYAHYSGDGTNAPSDSAPVTVTVGKESSQAFIVIPTYDSNGNPTSGNATSITYGSFYILTLYATDQHAVASTTGPPTPACFQENILACPTGTISLTDNGTPLGTGHGGAGIYSLNSMGHTENVTLNLTGGTHNLAATYSGDNSYQPSNPAATTLTVTPAPMTLTLSPTSNPVTGIPSETLVNGIATAPGGGVAPTGTLTVYDGTTVLGSPYTVPGNAGTPPNFGLDFTITLTTGGTHTLTAKYSGDSNYASATSAPQTVHAFYATNLNVQASSTTVSYGTSITVTATVSTGIKTPAITGQISFNSSSGLDKISVGATTESTDASGNVILQTTATLVPQASEAITAVYSGDSNYAPGTPNSVDVTVNIPDFSLAPAGGISVIPVAGQPGSGQITITPLSQTPSTVTLSLSPLGISGYTIALSPQQVSLNGSPVTATLSLTPTSSSTPSNALRARIKHAGILAVKPDNWWLLSLVTGLAAFILLGIPGRRKRLRSVLGLTAVSLLFFTLGCGGGGGSSGGGSGGGGQGPQPTTIAVTTSNAKVAANAPFTITATITASKPLMGTVTFYNFGTAIAGGFPVTDNEAQIGSGYINSPGLYQITASYSGDPNNNASTSSPITQVITGTMPATIQAATGGDVHFLQATIGVQ